MSVIAVESSECSGIPRLSDVTLTIIDDEDFKFMESQHFYLNTQEYFCPQGHAFSINFIPGAKVPSCWECHVCETLALNHPPF